MASRRIAYSRVAYVGWEAVFGVPPLPHTVDSPVGWRVRASQVLPSYYISGTLGGAWDLGPHDTWTTDTLAWATRRRQPLYRHELVPAKAREAEADRQHVDRAGRPRGHFPSWAGHSELHGPDDFAPRACALGPLDWAHWTGSAASWAAQGRTAEQSPGEVYRCIWWPTRRQVDELWRYNAQRLIDSLKFYMDPLSFSAV